MCTTCGEGSISEKPRMKSRCASNAASSASTLTKRLKCFKKNFFSGLGRGKSQKVPEEEPTSKRELRGTRQLLRKEGGEELCKCLFHLTAGAQGHVWSLTGAESVTVWELSLALAPILA